MTSGIPQQAQRIPLLLDLGLALTHYYFDSVLRLQNKGKRHIFLAN
jgi:hypothetical protein